MSQLSHKPEKGRPRVVASLFIAFTLLVAIGTPASYYVGDGSYDERFAWRMFSGKRAEKCGVQVIETRLSEGKESRHVLPLTRIIHKAWESGLRRLRPDIVDAFLERRCALPETREVLLIRRCRRADGSRKPDDQVQKQCALRVTIP